MRHESATCTTNDCAAKGVVHDMRDMEMSIGEPVICGTCGERCQTQPLVPTADPGT